MKYASIKTIGTAMLSFAAIAPVHADVDVGGIKLGMKADDVLKIIKNDVQDMHGQLGTVNFTLSIDRAQNKQGAFKIYTATWRNAQSASIVAIGVSPLTGTVWSVTKSEIPQSARPSLQAIADAAKKFGKVNAGAVTNAEYIQRWMYNGKGAELEWANSYDKPQNGNCFSGLQSASVAGTDLWFPVQPTSACSTVYWVNAKSGSHDGMATSYASVAVDVTAFQAWFQSIDSNKQKSIDLEKSSAAKPQL